ncbi:MAG: hypothetical protein ACIAXF_09845 [Phycisphaerales bacterium JB063]
MTTFNTQPLFASGPSRTTPGPVELRTAKQDAPAGVGTTLLSQGKHARAIRQQGQLHADSPAELYELMDAIEDMIDGLPYTFCDEHGRAWLNTVMTRFEPGAVVRCGTRVMADYEIHYTQVLP